MKKTLLFFLILGMISSYSCKDDPCDDVVCQNNGVCVEGNCDCADGYSGSNCEVLNREGLIGNWTGNLVCPGTETDLVSYTISNGATPAEIVIDFDGIDVLAQVTGPQMFSSESTTYEVSGVLITVQIDGFLNDLNTIVMNINRSVNGDLVTCNFEGI